MAKIISSLLATLFLSQALMAHETIRSYQVEANPSVMDQIATNFEVVKKLPKGYEVLVLEERVGDFLKLAPEAQLIQTDIHNTHGLFFDLNLDAGKYRKFANVESDLKALADKYHSITELSTYGVSSEGRNLYVLKVATGAAANKPKLLLTAATHGDELITTEVLFALTNELLEGYSKNSRLSKILDSHEIYIIPVVSPDSFEQRERYINGVDPNRSFPWPEKEVVNSVDVIKALIEFTDKMKFTASLDLHAYGKLVMYPWGYTKNPPSARDANSFNNIVQSMARENHYTAGQISTTIYVAKGSSADYFYWKNGTQAIAVELGEEKVPSYNRIPAIVNESREMIWTFLEYFN